MATKTSVLELLERNRARDLSGSELARLLGVSRTAVWKAVGELKKEGYRIEAATNRGYRLAQDSNVLSVQGMLPYLANDGMAEQIHLFDQVESTNRTATAMVLEGADRGTVVIADSQSDGRGRRGRRFVSPPGRGIYLSVVLRPERSPDAALVTTAASVAVCRAVRKVTGQELSIKWVNDLFLEEKKVCGILTEAITDFEAGTVDRIVVGVGVNFSTLPDDFEPEIRQQAGSLLPGSTDGALRCRLAAELVNQLTGLDRMLEDRGFLEEYRRRSRILGEWVTILHPAGNYRAKALEIDASGRLLVELADGTTKLLSSGEVSLTME